MPGGSGAGGLAGGGLAGGAEGAGYLTTPRGPTSRLALEIQWEYPVYQEKAADPSERSRSVAAKRALPVKEALAYIAGDDPRPLLVLRECTTCTGTDDALLTRKADNEKTMLMSRWFHCVKLPADVLDEDHPFRNLFPEKDPSHLFVADVRGAQRFDLAGDQSRTELWGVMEKTLEAEYTKSHEKVLKELLGVLDEYDELDVAIADVKKRLDDVIEDDGPDSRKVAKLKKKLTELYAEKNELQAEAQRVSKLELAKSEGDAPATRST